MKNHGDEIRAFIVDRFLFGEDDLTDETPLFESGIVDSTGVLEIVAFIEERYGLTVPDEDLVPEHFATLGEINSYLDRRLAGSSY